MIMIMIIIIIINIILLRLVRSSGCYSWSPTMRRSGAVTTYRFVIVIVILVMIVNVIIIVIVMIRLCERPWEASTGRCKERWTGFATQQQCR